MNDLLFFNEAVSMLGISNYSLYRIIQILDIPLIHDEHGFECIRTDALKVIVNSEHYKEFQLIDIRDDLKRRIKEDNEEQSKSYKEKRLILLDEYRKYIKDLEIIHSKYKNKINYIENENALNASFILFSKVISLLYMTCDCLQIGHWYSGLIIIDIDETIDVAQYFLITENTEKGKKQLSDWYCLNKSPQHVECRKAIAEWEASINTNITKEHNEFLSTFIYRMKSKFVHPTFRTISEVFKYTNPDNLNEIDFDYATCTYERKLFELTDFFKSSIWTAFQGFSICFSINLSLDREDVKKLIYYDDFFNQCD